MEKAAYTKEQLEAYDKWKIAAMTERSALKDAKKEGKIEGKIEGIEEEKIKIAANLLKAGISIDIISNTTELSIEQIKNLK